MKFDVKKEVTPRQNSRGPPVANKQQKNENKRRLQFLANGVAMWFMLELVTGLEPATCSLRMSCTTNCATQAYLFRYSDIFTHIFRFPKASASQVKTLHNAQLTLEKSEAMW